MENELGSKQDFGSVKEKVKQNLQDVFDLEWINL
jgi:hypothetical protein